MEVQPEFQDNPAALSMLYVRSGNGQLVPLDTVASRHPRPWARNPSTTWGSFRP